ncbi:dipeptide epimerase [Ancylothrix sp. C2]|uniref:dipeptide epimerase n=1 Tax=Ancylothrix sp. D3o TaxID=2953691 RepID=UPI0021BA6B13|nr:dipeptide epimerase [Ancylothrix sp. D3o]MCT7949728.1 dipeptide epimerase [Ancylothrix sp. D3o]
MKIEIQPFTVHKRFALTISRGTTAQTTNIWVKIEHEGIEGWGEASPFSTGIEPQTTEILLKALQTISQISETFNPHNRQQIERVLNELKTPSAARAAIDTALHDWIGKKAQMPLWKMWGLNSTYIPPTSVTIGINTPEKVKERVRDWLNLTQAKILKVKLGSPDGIEADKAIILAVKEQAPTTTQITIDANGGWNLENAIKMSEWLAEQQIKYVEQPLPRGQENDLPALKKRSPLPIFVDESCFTSRDIPPLANCVDGINIKLMKAGGLTEALRMIHTAKACGLQIMFGCYSDSTLANTAMSHLAPLADYLDLDSHLNLTDDFFTGATLQKGCLTPNENPGIGVTKTHP